MPGRAITQDQLNRLFTATLETAVGRIEKDGHFHPLVFELRDNGAIHNVAVLDTDTIDGRRTVIDRLFAILRPRVADGIVQACAIALDRHEDAEVAVLLRAPNFSANIAVPYTEEGKGFLKLKRRLSLGQFASRDMPNELF